MRVYSRRSDSNHKLLVSEYGTCVATEHVLPATTEAMLAAKTAGEQHLPETHHYEGRGLTDRSSKNHTILSSIIQ